MLAAQLPRLKLELEKYAENLEDEVMTKIGKLEEVGWTDYGKK